VEPKGGAWLSKSRQRKLARESERVVVRREAGEVGIEGERTREREEAGELRLQGRLRECIVEQE